MSAIFHINWNETSPNPALSKNLQDSICQGWKHNTHIITKSKLVSGEKNPQAYPSFGTENGLPPLQNTNTEFIC